MNIALSTDDNYVIPALACLTSVFENNKESECNIYVLTKGLNTESTFKFNQLSAVYSQKIEIINIDDTKLERLSGRGRYAKATYYRFLLPQILKGKDRVLYIDCDIINVAPLTELYSTTLDNHSCAVVVDQNYEDLITLNRTMIKNKYFNAGVLLMNLDYWRKENILDKLIATATEHPEMCYLLDQDALNIVLDGTVIYLDYRYNYQEFWYNHRHKTCIRRSEWENLDRSADEVVLIHYCADIKPWFDECGHPRKADFDRYASMHGFVGYKSRKYFNFKYATVSKIIRRLTAYQKTIKH